MALDNIMFNIGINVDADQVNTETMDVVKKLQEALNKNGITVPLDANTATIKQLDQYLQSLGGHMTIVKDATTGFLKTINVNIPKANGQILNLSQSVRTVYQDIMTASGAMDVIATGFDSGAITASISGQNTEFEKSKELQNDIVSLAQKRVDLEMQLANALVNNDSKEQATLQNKLDKNTELDSLYRDQLQYLQDQANISGQNVDYFSNINQQIQSISEVSENSRQIIESGKGAIELAKNLKEYINTLDEYWKIQQKIVSSSPGDYQNMLVEQFKEMQPQVEAVTKDMQEYGVQLDNSGAHYDGTITAIQKLVEAYNDGKTALEQFANKMNDAAAQKDQANYIKQLSSDLSEYFKILKQINSSDSIDLTNQLQSQLDTLDSKYQDTGGVIQSVSAIQDSAFQSNIKSVDALIQKLQQLQRAQQVDNIKTENAEKDKQIIEETVAAYKEYTDALTKVKELQKEHASSNDIQEQKEKVQQLQQSYEELEKSILSNGEAVKKNTEYNREKNQVTREMIQEQKKLDLVLKDDSLSYQIAQTMAYAVSLDNLQNVIQSVVQQTISLNDAMTQIRLVTQGTQEETQQLMNDYVQIAKDLGTTVDVVADSAVEWQRQGYSIQETNDLIYASSALSVIGAMNSSDATQALTASLNGYNMEASQAMNIVDQLTTLDLYYATSAGDIANALSRVASSAKDAGIPLERMEAIITVTADRTQQAAETIGRA